MGFVRRYTTYPSQAQIQAIEGVVIVDQAAPSPIQGVGTGVVAMVGEFADMSFAVALAKATGIFTTLPQPVQIFSAADLIAKCGGFDETIGDFGNSGGNAYAKIRNKTFAGLVAVPVNLASQYGARVVRQLPTNAGATAPVPAVPMSAAQVPAGTEFKTGNNRMRIAKAVKFTGDAAFLTGTDGSVTAAGAAEHGTLTSAGSNFITAGVKKGDIVVLGVIGAAGAQGANAASYRVTAVTDATNLEVEHLDGANFTWSTGGTLAFRIHVGNTADSYGDGNSIFDASQIGYTVPARPLDATIPLSTVLTPTVAQPAGTATAWSPLSGLQALTGPNAVVYTAAVQAPNAVAGAALEALYQTAINALLADAPPSKGVSIALAARTSAAIRTSIKTFDALRSSQGRGVTSPTSPALNTDGGTSTQSTSNIVADVAPGVGANRAERVDYNWPGNQEFVPEAVGFAIGTADGGTTTDGMLDMTTDVLAASIMSNLAADLDPAQITDAVASLTSFVTDFQRGAPSLGINDYIALKAAGVMALKHEDNGFFFQSGVTTSLTSGQTDINRRRFADEIQDTLAKALGPYAKLPLTHDLRDNEVGQVVAYFDGLLSQNNPPAARLAGYVVDDKSGNTPDSLAAGYNVIITRARMLPEQKEIVIVSQVGPNVIVTAQ